MKQKKYLTGNVRLVPEAAGVAVGAICLLRLQNGPCYLDPAPGNTPRLPALYSIYMRSYCTSKYRLQKSHLGDISIGRTLSNLCKLLKYYRTFKRQL